MQRLLFLLITNSFHGDVLIPVHCTFFPWRKGYSFSCHVTPTKILLFMFLSSSCHAEVTILIHFQIPLVQKLLFLFISASFHAAVVILVHSTFLPCRSCNSRSFCIVPCRSFNSHLFNRPFMNNHYSPLFHIHRM